MRKKGGGDRRDVVHMLHPLFPLPGAEICLLLSAIHYLVLVLSSADP